MRSFLERGIPFDDVVASSPSALLLAARPAAQRGHAPLARRGNSFGAALGGRSVGVMNSRRLQG
jgi:hypothetical protein